MVNPNEEVKVLFVESVPVDHIEHQGRKSEIEHVAQEDSQSQVYKNLLLDSEGGAVRVSQDVLEATNNMVKPYQEALAIPNDQEAFSQDGDPADTVAKSIR